MVDTPLILTYSTNIVDKKITYASGKQKKGIDFCRNLGCSGAIVFLSIVEYKNIAVNEITSTLSVMDYILTAVASI